jgi:hypothetical protein
MIPGAFSGPKGREEIATSVRAWGKRQISLGGPKGRQEFVLRDRLVFYAAAEIHAAPSGLMGKIDWRAHALTDVATTWRAFGAH